MRLARLARLAMLLLAGAGAVLFAAPSSRANFLVSSTAFGTVIQLTDTGAFVNTFIPSGGMLFTPWSMAMGPDGNVYVGDNGKVLVYNANTGAYIRTAFTGGGVMTGIAFAANGDMFVSTQLVDRVYRVNPDNGALIATIGVGTITDPDEMAIAPDGNVLVGAGSGNTIWKIDVSSNAVSSFVTSGSLSSPIGLDYGVDGNLYSLNSGGDKSIYRIDPNTGTVLGFFASSGINAPSDLLFVPGNRLWAADLSSQILNYFNATTGAFQGSVMTPSATGNMDLLLLPEPNAMAFALLIAPPLMRRNPRRM